MLYGFINNSVRYYYVRDLQQRIVGIVNESGEYVAGYKYDSFGITVELLGDVEIARINSFRYKGYYYDNETGFYYCKTRYYNPYWCRWLTADDITYLDPQSISGLNLFAYCANNPIMCLDPNGHILWWIALLITIAVVAVVVAAIVVPAEVKTHEAEKIEDPVEYESIDDLAKDWAQDHYNNSIERGSVILSKEKDGKTVYYYDRVYYGTNNSIAFGFYSGYVHYGLSAIPTRTKIVGFIHSHPSGGTSPSEADKFIKTLAGIDVSYIAGSPSRVKPYETDKNFFEALWDMIKRIPDYL